MTIGIAHHNPQTISLMIDRLQNTISTIERDNHDFEKLINILNQKSEKPIILLCDTVEVVLRLKNKIKHPKLKNCIVCIFDTPDELLKYQKIRIVDAVQENNSWRLFSMTQQAFNQAILESEAGCLIDEISYGKYSLSECLRQLLMAILDDGNYCAISTLLAAKYRRGLKAAENNELTKLIAKSELSKIGLEKLETAATENNYLPSLMTACKNLKDGCDLNQLASDNNIAVKDLIWVLSWKQYDVKKK